MTQEEIEQQYYLYYMRRQQMLKSMMFNNRWSNIPFGGVGYADDRKWYRFQKTQNPFLFKCTSDGEYDEDVINCHFENYAYRPAAIGCSSARRGNFHGRNYDWYFDRAPSFIVRTPKTDKHIHSTLGVAQLMHMEASWVKDGWNENYEFLECAIVDGINDCGLVCNLNVVPPCDNPNYPTLKSEQDAIDGGIPLTKVRNFTFGTNEGKPRRFVGAICRTILDNCSDTEEVKDMLGRYSWYAARNPYINFNEEFHVMVSDRNKTLVIEFVENSVVVHEWTSDGMYLGCSDKELEISNRSVLPIMTNFYISKWDGNVDNLAISKDIPVEQRNATVTEYGMGYERYVLMDNVMRNNPYRWSEDEFVEKLLRQVSYRQIYTSEYDKWVSEFLLRESKLNYRMDMLDNPDFIDFRIRAELRCIKEDDDDKKGIRPKTGVTWQTVHNSTYDIENLSLKMYAQEDYENPIIEYLED